MMRTLMILLCLGFSLGLQGQFIFAQGIENIILGVAWSPDGESISYLASDGIHVVDNDGNNNRLIVPRAGFGGWTADSSAIFVIKNGNPLESTMEWWVYPVDETEPFQFLAQMRSITTIAYSHDGDQIAISAQENESDPYMIWVANADGSQLRSLAEYQTYDLHWSDDDSQIIFETLLETDEKLQTVEVSINISGNQTAQIQNPEDGMQSLSGNLSFSYEPDASFPPTTFYIRDILDNRETLLTINHLVGDIDYSGQNESIVYTTYCDPASVEEAFLQGEWSAMQQATVETAMYLIDTETGIQTDLITCGNGSQMDLSFSPDGQEILFVWIDDQQWNIHTMNIEEAHLLNLSGR